LFQEQTNIAGCSDPRQGDKESMPVQFSKRATKLSPIIDIR